MSARVAARSVYDAGAVAMAAVAVVWIWLKESCEERVYLRKSSVCVLGEGRSAQEEMKD
jgi:hypothetical protein